MCIIQDIKKLQLRRQLCLRRPRYVSFLPSWANVWPPDASAHMQVSVQTEQLPCLPSTTKLECSAWLKCNMEDISPSGVLTYMIGAQKGVPCHLHPFSMFRRTSTRQNIHTRIWTARVSTEELDFIMKKSRGNTQISCKAPTADLAASVEHDSSLYSSLEISYTTKLNLSPVRMSYGFWPLL